MPDPGPTEVHINECFARDGLQHETVFVDTDVKIELLTGFAAAGFRRIEATSYSSPKRVPAFADASDVLRLLPRRPDVSYKATCPNERAVQRAIEDLEAGHGPEELSLLTSASDAHSQVNLKASRAEQWDRVREMAAMARGKFRLVGVVSVAFGCPFEGRIDPEVVRRDVARFRELGADVVTIGDTTGLAQPREAAELIGGLVAEHSDIPVVAHFHDTRGLGLANVMAAFEAGCRHFDTAMGGIGGHPAQIEYGAGQTGNVSTEDTVNLFDSLGVSTGLDLDRVLALSRRCEDTLGRELNSKVARAGYAQPVLAGGVAA